MATQEGKVITVVVPGSRKPVNLAMGSDGRIKFSYGNHPPDVDLLTDIEDYDSGIRHQLKYLEKEIAELRTG